MPRSLPAYTRTPLFLLLLHLRKAHDTMNRDRLLITLEGYVSGPRLCGLLETFWDCQQVVTRQNGFRRPDVTASRGTTQGGLVSPMLFNMVVDNFIRTWQAMTLEDQRVAHDGLGETVGQCLELFYADDGMVGSRDSDWLQNAMNALVGLFRRYVLAANVTKSHTMTCQTGALRAGMSEESMALKCTGAADSYQMRLQRRIPCL